EEHKLGCLFLDPAYLMMAGIGDAAGNMFAVGGMLQPLNEIITKTGCAIVLLHHSSRTAMRKDKSLAPELGATAWAGFAEWARSWVMLKRGKAFDPESDGIHQLLMSSGGSAGHYGFWALDITEGRRSDPDGRHWHPVVKPAREVLNDEASEEDERRET